MEQLLQQWRDVEEELQVLRRMIERREQAWHLASEEARRRQGRP